MKYHSTKNAKLRLQCLCELCALCGETVRVNLQSASNIIVENTGFWYCARNGKRRKCARPADKLPVLYLILRAGAGVDAGIGRAYGVRDF